MDAEDVMMGFRFEAMPCLFLTSGDHVVIITHPLIVDNDFRCFDIISPFIFVSDLSYRK